MQEFTLRNKSTRPILTLKPAMLKKLLESRPESTQLVLGKYRRDYKSLTGKNVILDHDQEMLLLKSAGADERGTWTSPYSSLKSPMYNVISAFQDGFLNRTLSEGMSEDLVIAEAFYSMLDGHIAEEK